MAVFIPTVEIPGNFLEIDGEGKEAAQLEMVARSTVYVATENLTRASYSVDKFQRLMLLWERGKERQPYMDRQGDREGILQAEAAKRGRTLGISETAAVLAEHHQQTGTWPWSIETSMAMMFAESYVCSLHIMFACIEMAVAEHGLLQQSFAVEQAAFSSFFPDLALCRNSIQHVDERLRGYQQSRFTKGEKVAHDFHHGYLTYESLKIVVLDRYEPGGDNRGRQVTIPVTHEGIRVARQLLQAFIRSFPWEQRHPSVMPFLQG